MPQLLVHAGRHYAVQFHYALLDDAWCVELSEAVPAPASWAGIPGSVTHLPGHAFVVAVIPDEDPSREPLVHVAGDHAVPYEVLRWFMEKVAEEVERCRLASERGAPPSAPG